jgi:hypothetical protein
MTCTKGLPNLNITPGLDKLLHLGIKGGDDIGGDGPLTVLKIFANLNITPRLDKLLHLRIEGGDDVY